MRQSNMNETTIASQKCSEYDDILSTLCTFSLLYNTGHSLQQLERIARIARKLRRVTPLAPSTLINI